MNSRGHTVSVIAGTTGVLSQQLVKNGVGFKLASAMRRTINPFSDVIAFIQIRNYLKELDPDIVSCHSSKAGWLAGKAGRMVFGNSLCLYRTWLGIYRRYSIVEKIYLYTA